jgi:hypothetical protein
VHPVFQSQPRKNQPIFTGCRKQLQKIQTVQARTWQFGQPSQTSDAVGQPKNNLAMFICRRRNPATIKQTQSMDLTLVNL